MALVAKCPCGRKHPITEALQGSRLRCPGCRRVLLIGAPPRPQGRVAGAWNVAQPGGTPGARAAGFWPSAAPALGGDGAASGVTVEELPALPARPEPVHMGESAPWEGELRLTDAEEEASCPACGRRLNGHPTQCMWCGYGSEAGVSPEAWVERETGQQAEAAVGATAPSLPAFREGDAESWFWKPFQSGPQIAAGLMSVFVLLSLARDAGAISGLPTGLGGGAAIVGIFHYLWAFFVIYSLWQESGWAAVLVLLNCVFVAFPLISLGQDARIPMDQLVVLGVFVVTVPLLLGFLALLGWRVRGGVVVGSGLVVFSIVAWVAVAGWVMSRLPQGFTLEQLGRGR